MAKKTEKDLKQAIVEKTLALAEQQSWDSVGLPDIAQAAGLTLAEMYDLVEDKGDILALFGRMIDRRVLEAIGPSDANVSERDRLFDLLMERFDVLNEYRPGLVSILQSFRFDPKQAVIAAPHLCRSMSWMLEAAGIETGGITGAVKVAGLTGVYLKTLRVWRDDESADLAKVMAALDKDLGRVERAANTLGF
ncbi:MAG: TetR family transcriptional regulator [Rhodospirillales bacterium]|nr:TetR family transcriptional regulator [Rhodospirillales bacterium]